MSKRSWTKDEFIKAVESSDTKADALNKIGLVAKGGNYATFDKYVDKWDINVSHYLGQRKPNGGQDRMPDSEVFGKNSGVSHSALRHRAREVLDWVCDICGNEGMWQGKELTLQLDHINGDGSDNRKENLRFLCPNCHSQTDTFGSRNICETEPNRCVDCDSKISKNAKRCTTCSNQHKANTKINWPDVGWLKSMVNEYSYLALSRRLGVSDNAVRKRIKKYS